MRPFMQLPGLLESLVGMTAGTSKTFDLVLPENYPITELAGKTAEVQVYVHEIYEVETPELDDLSAIRGSGLGNSLDEAMDAVAAEIDEEQGAQLLVDASEAVLWEFSDRVQGEVPEEAIDEELRRSWEEQQGELLADMGLAEDVREDSRQSYIASPQHREDVRRRLLIGMGLAALVEAEGIAPSAEVMQTLLDSAADAVGRDSEAVKEALAADPERARQAAETALHLTAVEFVMERAKVEVIDPE
jgi:trigger factor